MPRAIELSSKSLPNKHVAVKRVGDLKNLQAEIGVDAAPGQPGAHSDLRGKTVV